MYIFSTVRILLLLVVFTATGALAQTVSTPLTGLVPLDPAVRVGVLPNGLKYYIRANKKPENRAELRLAISAGALQEDDDQRGLAHFIEHMAFNGTKNFPKHKLVDYLESIGMKFGADLNAFTDFDRTVYMLQVPTDTGKHLDAGLQMLEDWAHNITFDSAEIEAERPVILGEWRSRLGAEQRVQEKQLPIMFKGSRYPDRLPIGLVKTIESARRDKLTRFYTDWYRPELMTVVAVGNFDPDVVEGLIREKFSRVPKAASPRKLETYSVPAGSGTDVSIVSDPELTSTSGTILIKGIPHIPARTVEGYRNDIVRYMYNTMLNQRMSEIARKPDAPFLGAGGGHSKLGPDLVVYQMGVGVRNNELERGIEAALAEMRRVELHGFTQTELDRAKQSYVRYLESSLASKDDIQSANIAEALMANFLDSLAAPSIEMDVAIGRQIAPTITLADMNREAKLISQAASRVVLVTLPEKSDIKKPVESQLVAMLDAATRKNVEAYKEAAVASALMDKMPAPGKVVSETRDNASGVITWKLSNGARVLLKPTTFRADEIFLGGYSPGGYQLATDADFIPAFLATNIVGAGGYGQLSLDDMRRVLTGKVANVYTSLGASSESIQGSASPKDVETMFQLLYLNFTAPRYDSATVAVQIAQIKSSLANRDASPGTAFSDTVNLSMTQRHPRAPIVTSTLWDKAQPKRAYEFYRERFANASDFTFAIVGSFTPDSIKPLIERYVASLPGTGKVDKIADPGIRPPSGVVHKVVRAGKEPQANVLLLFHGPFEKGYKNSIELNALADVLNLRMLERIREQLGGSYGVQVRQSTRTDPRSEYTVQINFVAAPERVDELAKAVLEEVEKIKREGPTADELLKVKEGAVRAIEAGRQRNDMWMNILTHDRHGWPLADVVSDAAWTALTGEQIRAAAQKYLNSGNYARFDLVPEVVAGK